MASPEAVAQGAPVAALADFVRAHPRLAVLTGAGISTGSGIPDYRDADGEWKQQPPVDYRDFVRSLAVRKRYWARSLVGWQRFARARPNAAHRALARLEHAGHVADLITQNVDSLHQRAGHRRVIDLHGRLSAVLCLDCGSRFTRAAVQWQLVHRNPAWRGVSAPAAPDGDALLAAETSGFDVPACAACDGMLKPDVVFFGEQVPAERVAGALGAVREADALLVIGSSLMVFSGYRFVREARRLARPVAAVNLGRTRADAEFTLKLSAPCAPVLEALGDALGAA